MGKLQIDQLINNSPHEEPSRYGSYHREVRMFERKDGRRPAGYVVATPGSKAFDDPGKYDDEFNIAPPGWSRSSGMTRPEQLIGAAGRTDRSNGVSLLCDEIR